MSILLRTVLTWLLVLALPAQGYAAQAMLFCGPAHHPAVAVVTDHDHAVHDHTAGPVMDGSHAAEPGHDVADVGSGAATHAKCSVCASCCSAAAIDNAALFLAAVPLAADYGAAAFERHDGRSDGGLDRPPKSFLA